jgi:outer membrane protein assembly factor BamB
VTAAGKVAWHASLPAAANGVTDALSPVVSGNQVIFAEGHSLVALRLSDGHLLWRRVFPEAKNSLAGQITFLYGFHSEVIALVGQVSGDTRLVAVSVKTGAVAWALPLGPSAVIGAPAVTVDSVFGFLTPHGRLKAVSLWTGKLLWSRAYGLAAGQPAIAALGSRFIAARSSDAAGTASSVTSFVAQTGKPLWTRTGMPGQPTLLGAPGGVFVYDVDQNVSPLPPLFPVTELNSASGKTQWRIPTGGPVNAVWLSWSEPDLLVIATTGRTPRLIGANPLTHRVRWSAKAPVDTDTTPLLFAGALGYLTTFGDPATLVMRDGSDGPVRWSRSIPSAQPHYLTATGGGTILLSYGQATVPGKAGALVIGWTGKVTAKISLPAPAQAPPAVTEGGDTVLQLDTLQCATAAVGTAS